MWPVLKVRLSKKQQTNIVLKWKRDHAGVMLQVVHCGGSGPDPGGSGWTHSRERKVRHTLVFVCGC